MLDLLHNIVNRSERTCHKKTNVAGSRMPDCMMASPSACVWSFSRRQSSDGGGTAVDKTMDHTHHTACCWVQQIARQDGTLHAESVLRLYCRLELGTDTSSAALTGTLRPAGDWLLVEEQRADAHQQRKDCRGRKDAAGAPHSNLRRVVFKCKTWICPLHDACCSR